MESLLRWYHTLRPLKAVQWWHLLTRPLMMRLSRMHAARPDEISAALAHPAIGLACLPVRKTYYPERKQFCFLNRVKRFSKYINWDYADCGLLWTYNLNYFEWLYDNSLSSEDRLETVVAFVRHPSTKHSASNQCYPISLRAVSWIRFLLHFNIKDESIIGRLFSDLQWLYRFPEYQLQGNHLWENAIALLCGGLYFQNERFYDKGKSLLIRCIDEQVLEDGGHIEGSPMYHSLLVWRLLQCVELLRFLPHKKDELEQQITTTAQIMLGWLNAMTFSDGSWPMLNDCAPGIAPSTNELLDYARQLNITPTRALLRESGYRMIRFGDFELAIDLAPVQPASQPGHAHADIGTFCVHYKGKPFIVDTGASTYEISGRRTEQRSTSAHNTLVIGGKNSAELWKSFRVARRPRILSIEEKERELTLSYCPYAFPSLIHRRTFSWNDNCLQIADLLDGPMIDGAISFLHFHPDIIIEKTPAGVFRSDDIKIHTSGALSADITTVQIANGFNRLVASRRAGFGMNAHLITMIKNV